MICLVRGGSQKFPSTSFAGEVVADKSTGPSPFIRILRPFRDVSAYSGVRVPDTLYAPYVYVLYTCTYNICTCDSCILDNIECAYTHGSIFSNFTSLIRVTAIMIVYYNFICNNTHMVQYNIFHAKVLCLL